MIRPRHRHVVPLHCTLSKGFTLSLVYDKLDMSLSQLFSVDTNPWLLNRSNLANEEEEGNAINEQTSAVCYQVCLIDLVHYTINKPNDQILSGSQYVHETLKIPHGEIYMANILMDNEGDVKLGESPNVVIGYVG